jgi:hypothetical protein
MRSACSRSRVIILCQFPIKFYCIIVRGKTYVRFAILRWFHGNQYLLIPVFFYGIRKTLNTIKLGKHWLDKSRRSTIYSILFKI